MIKPNPDAGASNDSAPTLRALNAPGDSTAIHLRLRPSDKRQLERLKDKLAPIVGRRASTAVILRASLTVMDHFANQVAGERRSRPDTRGKRELNLLWWLSNAARVVAEEQL